MAGNVNFSLPAMSAATLAAMKEDISAYKVDMGTGDTNLDFDGWLKSSRPQRYQTYRDLVSKQAK